MAWPGTDPNDIEQNFNARYSVPDFADSVERCRAATTVAKKRLGATENIRYGGHPLETLDWYPAAAPGAPVHLFVHGGYWRAHDKDDFGLVAAPLAAAGAHVAVVNYPLCPEVTVTDIVASIIAAVAWVWRHAADFGAEAADFTLSGHSAGAHLAAMALCHDWVAEGLPARPFGAAVLISGLYELEPVLAVSVNAAEIHLTADMVPSLSPMRFPPTDVPMLLAVGGDEAPLWMRQSADFAKAARAAGGDARYLEVPRENHFSLMEAFADATHPLTRATVDFLFRRVALDHPMK
jgi:arylformamidase